MKTSCCVTHCRHWSASLLSAIVGTVVLLLPAHAASSALSAAPKTRFDRSIAPVADTATDATGQSNSVYVTRQTLQPAEAGATTKFEVALAMRNFDELEARLAHSEIITPDEMSARYLPLAIDHERVVRWLADEGLTITRTDANRLAVFAQGSVTEVARVLGTSFARVSADGVEYTAAITAPAVPAPLAAAVRGIHGLQPYQRLRLRPHALRPLVGSGSGLPYYPNQIAKAYNANTLSQTGTGQTIAVYALAFPSTSDLTTFWTTTGVAASTGNIKNVTVADGPIASPTQGFIDEATLDVEWASALAPGAVIRIYGASEDDPVGDDELIQQILADLHTQPNLHQVSISFGADESSSPRDYIAIEAQYMATLVSAGVTVFAASGDAGALGNNGAVQVGYPASMPDVTAVGGTTLTLNTDGTVANEIAWGKLTNRGSSGSTGGGYSVIFNRPSWQAALGLAGVTRMVPDVAAVADPNTGAFIVSGGTTGQIGGTSLSTPVWAAWCALMNQARASAGKAPLGALNPRLYPLMGTSAFRDITSGGNSVFAATTGYDLCTGIGVPNIAALTQATLSDTFAPVIEVPSGDRFTIVGQNATFYVIATAAPAPTFRWQRLAVGAATWADLTESAAYVGTATYALSVNGATLSNNGDQFRCIINNTLGSATSPSATLTVGTTGVSTLAGWPGWSGFADGQGSAGRFNYTGSVRVDSAGTVYVADASNHTVRKITPTGVVSTLAGAPGVSGMTDGAGSLARFNGPDGVAVDSAGNVFVSEAYNYTVRKITPAGVVSTVAGTPGVKGFVDGTGSGAQFYDPQNIAIDSVGNLYVADGAANAVRKVTPAGVVTTLAGNGPTHSGYINGTGSAALFNNLTGIGVDRAGNVYVGDSGNNAVRKITPAGVVTTLAGATSGARGTSDGTGSAARFYFPSGMGVDAAGNVYVADSLNLSVRRITAAGVVTTVTGSSSVDDNIDGPLSVARFSAPSDVALDPSGVLYVADAYNCTIRRVVQTALTGPAIVEQPLALSVGSGNSGIFFVTAQGVGTLSYQWQQLPLGASAWTTLSDAGAFSGTATAVLRISTTTTVLDGTQFRCLVQDTDGTTATTPAALYVQGTPVAIATSQSQSVHTGGYVVLTANIGGGNLTYQWQLNGTPIAGATSSTLSVSNFQAVNSGTYTVIGTNATGTATATVGTLGTTATILSNLSVRTSVGTGANALFTGFAIGGSGTRQVLVRGDGPSLTAFGVTGVLTNPVLSLFNGSVPVATNSGWGNSATLSATFARVGAFAFPSNSVDTAILQTLSPSAYSAQLAGAGSTTGIALVELYDAGPGSGNARLTNLSSRANVGSGSNILIVGFVVAGSGTEKLLIRGAGPTLTAFGVGGVLAHPKLTVQDANGNAIAANAGWADDPILSDAFARVGAFTFQSGSTDSAVIVSLPPGIYNAQIVGADGTGGIALVEVYELN